MDGKKYVGVGIIILVLGFLVSCQEHNGDIDNTGADRVYKDLIEEYHSLEKSHDRESPEANMPEIALSNGKIIQPFFNFFEYYALVPPDCRLSVKLHKGHRQVAGFVDVQTDDSALQRFQFTKNGSHQVDLSPWEGKYIHLRFGITSRKKFPKTVSKYYIEWENVTLQVPQPQVSETENHDLRQSKDLADHFQQYDIVYVVLDAFHAAHASLYGYPKKTTPFLDSIAQESLVFDNMFANAPYTLASTGVLFTSRYTREHGLISDKNALNRIIPTLAELLTAVDVETYLITIHGYLLGDWGLSRGFSTIIKENYGADFDSSQKAIERVYASNSAKRKFIYIHVGPPHDPYHPPEEFRTFVKQVKPDYPLLTAEYLLKFERQELQMNDEHLEYILSWYDSHIVFADRIAQTVFDTLKKLEVLEKTIFIVTSDHGEAFLQHGRMLHGSTVFDEMLHIPFLMRFPKDAPIVPRHVQAIASLVDITPTLADIYGLKELPEFSGKSLFPLFFDETSVNPFIYAEAPAFETLALRDPEYKYIRSREGHQLYHLPTDPLEQTDLIEEHSIVVRYYRQLMNTFLARHASVSSNVEVELEQQNEEVLQNLRELGYIK